MIEALVLLLLGILAMAAIIAANGYFVAQEFAYMSVDRARLRARAEEGDKAAAAALAVTRRTSFMLSGAQLGITVTGLMVGYVAEPLVGRSLGMMLGGVGVPSVVSISVGTVSALAVATVVQMVFGELYPKNLAIAAPEPLARALARSTRIYLAAFGWLITVFDHAANALLRLLRIEPVHDVDTTATAADLDRIVADSRESGDLPEELSMLIDRVLEFPDRTVEHAMIPRSRAGTVTPETTIAELYGRMAGGHTRYPVLSEDEEPVGVAQLGDLLERDDLGDAPVSGVMRDPLVLPTLAPLPEALDAMTESGRQLACIIDEYGGFSGILTLEDLAEELIGEIGDEHDDEPPPSIESESETAWTMDGDVHVDEVARAIGAQLPEGDYETLAGLVIATHEQLPEPGQVVRVELPPDPRELILDEPPRRALEIVVREVARHVPSELHLRLTEADDAAERAAETSEGVVEASESADGGSEGGEPDSRGDRSSATTDEEEQR
ncbi:MULTISPECIES: hemolysin family protein [unclassified Brachybacterium]|uniref:hemolysin family protein n=1 Tax=unclassified Brachybacterium TaxID=2623841 RepID=UPI003613F99A